MIQFDVTELNWLLLYCLTYKVSEPRTISDGIGPNKILAARSRFASWGASFLFIYLNFFLNSRMSKYIAEFTKKKKVFPYMFMSDINTVTLWS